MSRLDAHDMNEEFDYGPRETFEDTKRALENVEWKLGQELGLGSNFRRQLLALSRAGRLDETELVADWHELYASYLDWIAHPEVQRFDEVENPPPIRPSSTAVNQEKEEVAQGGLFTFCCEHIRMGYPAVTGLCRLREEKSACGIGSSRG